MLRASLAALVVFYVPGALLMRLPHLSRKQRAALPAEERVFWGLVLSVVWSLSVVLLLSATGLYTFNRLLAANGLVATAMLGWWRGALRYERVAPRASWPALLLAALLAGVPVMYVPAAEYVIGGKDPGVYLNEGVQIAQTGRLVGRDETVAAVPPEFRDLFFPQHVGAPYYGLRFMGFFVLDPRDGQVVGQFPHLFPASVAIGYGLNGLSGARDAITVWALLGLFAVYGMAARLTSPAAALGAAALLAVNVIEVWFARYPNSELPMQSLVFAAMLAASRAMDGGRAFFGTLAGILLGLMLLLRVDVVLAIAAFTAVAVAAPLARGRLGHGFGIGLALAGAAGAAYLVGPMRSYSQYPLQFFSFQGGWWLLGAAGLAAWVVRRSLRTSSVARAVQTGLPIGLAVTLAGLALYAYFFREQVGKLALGDAMAFRAFGWFVQPWMLGIATAAACVLIARRFWSEPAFFLTAATFAVFFFYKTRIVPEYFWASRRFLAVTLPAAIICAAAAADWIAGHIAARVTTRPTSQRRLSAAIVFALLLVPGLAYWRASAPVRHHVEYAGVVPRLERLASAVGPHDLLLVEARNAGSDVHTLALPLAYVYARHVLVLDSAVPPKRQFENFVAWAQTRYERVLFLGGGGTDLLTRQVAAVPLESARFQVPEYDSPEHAYPAGPRRKEFEFGLYKLFQAPTEPAASVDLSVGQLDDLNVVRFYARETHANGTQFRWSRGQSFLVVPSIPAGARRVILWLSDGGRPRPVPPAVVELALNDVVLGTATPDDELKPYGYDLPAALAARAAASGEPVRLRLRVNTWNPARVLGGDDTRDLGVMVARVEVR